MPVFLLFIHVPYKHPQIHVPYKTSANLYGFFSNFLYFCTFACRTEEHPRILGPFRLESDLIAYRGAKGLAALRRDALGDLKKKKCAAALATPPELN